MKFGYEFAAGLDCLRSAWVAMALSLVIGPRTFAAGPAPTTNDQASQERIQEIKQRIDGQLSSLETLYKDIHSHPELSLKEEHTSARLAQALRELGFEVTEKVGGYGVVGVLKNGPGPTILVRTDMDALPVYEQ